jgi:hypothetical protein
MLRASRVKEARLISVVREVAGRTTWRSDSRKDLSEWDDREENVGEGRAAARGEDGWVGSIKNRFRLGAELRISDMTESRGPDEMTSCTLGACLRQKGEVYSTIWLIQDRIQKAICAPT